MNTHDKWLAFCGAAMTGFWLAFWFLFFYGLGA